MRINSAIEVIYDYISETNDVYISKLINFLHFTLETYKSLFLFRLEIDLPKTESNLRNSIIEVQKKLKQVARKLKKFDADLSEALMILANADINELLEHSRDIILRIDKTRDLKERKYFV